MNLSIFECVFVCSAFFDFHQFKINQSVVGCVCGMHVCDACIECVSVPLVFILIFILAFEGSMSFFLHLICR